MKIIRGAKSNNESDSLAGLGKLDFGDCEGWGIWKFWDMRGRNYAKEEFMLKCINKTD